MKIVTVALALGIALAGPARADDGIRYIVPNEGGPSRNWKVWPPSNHWPWREIGEVAPGTAVEILDTSDCGQSMVPIRILAGESKGLTGCLTSKALTRIKSESQ